MQNDKPKFSSIDEYIAFFPADIQTLLIAMRSTIQTAAPEAIEKISYQLPTFFLKGNLVYFGVSKHHIGFYPTSSGIAAFQGELADYESTKGAIKFLLDKPLPLALIGEIVRFRVAENIKKAAGKARKTT